MLGMCQLVSRVLLLVLLAGGGGAQTGSPASWSDERLWADFAAWADALAPLPAGQKQLSTERYKGHLTELGASAPEADALLVRLHAWRRGSPERERVYWNARFKLGGGPDQPLRLLAETVRFLKPGRALDVATGSGRNGLYLARLGWDVTAYDIAPVALAAARRAAAEEGVELHAVEASHDTFDFGEGRWDLIVCSYAYMRPNEPQWPPRLWKALKPGGTVVVQSSWDREASLEELVELWHGFRVLRYEDLDAGQVDDEWPPSTTLPTVALVLRKPAS